VLGGSIPLLLDLQTNPVKQSSHCIASNGLQCFNVRIELINKCFLPTCVGENAICSCASLDLLLLAASGVEEDFLMEIIACTAWPG